MPTLSLISPWRHYATKTSSALEVTTYLLCAITLIVAMFDNTLSMKLYNVTAILGLLALLLRGKPESYSVQYWLLPLAIFIIGALDVVWYSAFKVDHSPFRATYHSYLNTAKIFLFGAFLTLLALTSRIRIKKELPLYILYSLSFFIAGYAYYIKSTTGMARLDFGIGTATGAAYSIMFVGIVSGISILYTQRNHPILFLLNAIAIFYALALTQTRSTLLIFPVICALSLVAGYIKSPKKLFFSVIGFLIALVVLIAIFSKPIYNRYHEGVSDLNRYSQGNSNSSLGARLAMYEIGFDIFKDAPFAARSADTRAERMTELAKEHKYLQGALEFSNVHLHNELIEAASLKGIAGVLSTLFFYIALFFTVYYHRSLGLFALTLAAIGIGLSDVILWSRSVPIIIITAIVLMLFLKKNRQHGDIASQ
ncbi:O-antigen ligase family protein [Citrobacter amalonaticus]|uniref:O-antigen ligase family protein n=1 Tax=Citrobacter amalonaticus TaxID=35703 RepID=UPI001787AD55|nr:O-antigen ligase [Citrobacter amalonaticus]MBE0397953.1 O-antigen ligase family protein [Citrobacter amalonaticus]